MHDLRQLIATHDRIAADPNLGVEATYRAEGTGAPLAIRMLRSSPDRVVDAFDTAVLCATDVLTVAIVALPAIEPGGTFTIGATC